MERLHTILSIAAVFEKTLQQKRNENVFNNCLRQMKLITSYKESNTEEKFNKIRIKHDHSKKHHTYIYWPE